MDLSSIPRKYSIFEQFSLLLSLPHRRMKLQGMEFNLYVVRRLLRR